MFKVNEEEENKFIKISGQTFITLQAFTAWILVMAD